MDTSEERRESVRTPFISKSFCRIKNTGRQHCGTLRDISITGLFMDLDDCPKADERCEIDIVFEGTHSRLVIEKVGGVIVRSEGSGVAVHFDARLEWFVLIPLYFHKIHDQSLVVT